MRFMFGINTRVFHAEFSTGKWATDDDRPERRDTQLDALVERSDQPRESWPIGFHYDPEETR